MDDTTGLIYDLALNLLLFSVVFLLIYITRYAINQNVRLQSAMGQLKLRTKQVEDMNARLRSASEELEEVTILKERNRIAREIHDTVGHTLTTVLLEMEAGELLLSRDPALAVEKIHLAKGQVRKGLNDIRKSVGVLKEGHDILAFVPSLEALIQDTMKHAAVYIRHDISIASDLTPEQQKTVYRALQEGLTNGIRHGKSTAFVFILKEQNGKIRFTLQDNGCGFEKLTPGFGLSAMEERVREVSGTLSVKSSAGQGCTIEISFPVKREDML